ncbi:hypothetical protein ACFOMD_11475 [Sphingoaurantiacus capsulatus]|uniref:Uncharacterized protein n=1 Tax=Sphingoaurantiacus capsulatus TaxID=1771310 RepID=A0ABV7XDW9_9SPHN
MAALAMDAEGDVPAGDAVAEATTGPEAPPAATETVAAAPPATAQLIDEFATRSGRWQLFALPGQGDAAVYKMTLDANPAFVREFACRPLALKDTGAATDLDLQPVRLLDIDATVAQGACRVVQNMSPVAPNLVWIREAAAARIIPSYRRERAWVAGLKPLARDPKRGAYDPKSLGPAIDKAPLNAGSNFVGVTSAQGGEYVSSRGFLHDADARVVDAALHGEESAVAAYWPEFEQYSLYSLAQPQGAAWSTTRHVTIDPQFPQEGERGWENVFYNNPHPDFDTAQAVTGWGRDVAHLENTGFIHWLATEDPIAGLLVQRQAAYALAGRWEYQRGGYKTTAAPADTRYEGYADQERGVFNTLSALWKSRDVSRRVQSAEGRMFWSIARTEAQAEQVIDFYDQTAARVAAAPSTSAADFTRQLAGTPFSTGAIGSFIEAHGAPMKLHQMSAFEAVQYGKESLWLWTRDGSPAVRRWFTAYANGLSARMAIVGGAMGVDGRTSTSGSGYPIGPSQMVGGYPAAARPAFNSTEGWAEWVASLPLQQEDSRDSFNGASVHTAMQMEGALLLARDAGLAIPTLDAALTRIRAARGATTTIRYASLQMHKHLASPPAGSID